MCCWGCCDNVWLNEGDNWVCSILPVWRFCFRRHRILSWRFCRIDCSILSYTPSSRCSCFFLLKDLHHIIHFDVWIFASVLFPPCQTHPDVHMVLVVVGILGFHFGWWTMVSLYLSNALDNITVQLPRLNLTLSCIIFFIVPYETPHNISVC